MPASLYILGPTKLSFSICSGQTRAASPPSSSSSSSFLRFLTLHPQLLPDRNSLPLFVVVAFWSQTALSPEDRNE